MNLRRWIPVKRVVCFLGALAALARVSVHGWETVLTRETPEYTVFASSIVLDPSDKWAAQRLFVGTWVSPNNDDVDPYPPGKLLLIDPNTGIDQEADLPKTRITEALGFSRTSGALFAYTAGYSDAEFPNRLLRSSDRGASWTTVDTLPTDVVNALAGDDEGNLFTAGDRWAFTNGLWRFLGAFIRKSIDDGHTWNTVDAPNGTEYSAPIQMSKDGGDTWQILRVPSPVGPRFSASAMLTDVAGNLYVLGGVSVQSGHAISSTVFRRNQEGNWDDLGPNADDTSLGSMALDPAGHLYVGGGYFTARPERALIVMRLALDPAGLPPLEITRLGGSVTVSWPTVDGVQLEGTNALDGKRQWEHVPVTPARDAGKSSVSIENDSSTRYFRLSKP